MQEAGAGAGPDVQPPPGRRRRRADDYLESTASCSTEADEPVVLHWLGDVRPGAGRLLGFRDLDLAADTVARADQGAPGKVDGIKVSLLDADREVALRRRLPAGVRLYTGDDFNYPELIRGDEQGHSDALLGHLRRDRAGRRRRAARAGRGRPGRVRPDPRADRAAGPAPVRGARPGTTRPASCSWPGWPGTRTTSPWSAARRVGRSPAHLAELSGWPTRPGCCPTPTWPPPAPGPVFTAAGVASR